MPVDALQIRMLLPEELPDAVDVLSRGMRDNPNNVRVFGNDSERRRAALRRLFRPVTNIVQRNGTVLGAYRSGSLAGVCCMTVPGKCQAGFVDKLRIIPAVVIGNSLRTLPRLMQWTTAWAKRDPKEGHWHLGPIAVDANLQGKGIGSALMRACCQHVDQASELAYLETDKLENVTFYERFGFVVVAEDIVVGEKNWFMQRARNAKLHST